MGISNNINPGIVIGLLVAILVVHTMIQRAIDPPSEREDSGYVCTEEYNLHTGPSCY